MNESCFVLFLRRWSLFSFSAWKYNKQAIAALEGNSSNPKGETIPRCRQWDERQNRPLIAVELEDGLQQGLSEVISQKGGRKVKRFLSFFFIKLAEIAWKEGMETHPSELTVEGWKMLLRAMGQSTLIDFFQVKLPLPLLKWIQSDLHVCLTRNKLVGLHHLCEAEGIFLTCSTAGLLLEAHLSVILKVQAGCLFAALPVPCIHIFISSPWTNVLHSGFSFSWTLPLRLYVINWLFLFKEEQTASSRLLILSHEKDFNEGKICRTSLVEQRFVPYLEKCGLLQAAEWKHVKSFGFPLVIIHFIHGQKCNFLRNPTWILKK